MKSILRTIGALITVVCCGVVCFSACGKNSKIADNTQFYDDVTKTLKLEKSYAGKNFYTDGIGSATVDKFTDGDTTLFKLDDTSSPIGGTANIRYYSIDTPESTGSVEKWGKSASLFVEQQLSKATEIVLEATTTPASKDSYGTRYLGYVWYKTADYNEFKCLNLEIVENGYSENKGINTSAYPYNEYFKKANDFAQKIKLRLYADLEDPLYSTAPVDTTVKEFNDNPSAFYNEELQVGSKIRFTAYLKSLTVANSGTHTFVAEQYDAETGKTYTINVYTGYNSSPASAMEIGHLYQIIGTVQKHDGNYQVAGPVYSALYPRPDNTHVKQYDYYWTFNSGVGYTGNNGATLYSDVTVTSVKVEGTVMTVEGTARKCKKDGYADAESFTFEAKVAEGYTPKLSVGNRFSGNAYKFDSGKNVWTIADVDGIVKK